jgi:dsDNA-specific endonuclease/ATPase MutS2
MASITHERSALGNTVKYHPDDVEAIAAARADLRYAVAEKRIREIVDAAPPLTAEQAAKLRALLPVPSAGDDHAAA